MSSVFFAAAAFAFGWSRCKRSFSSVAWAIEIARRAGMPLKIAAKVDKADRAYYNAKIRRLLKMPGIEFVGEIGVVKRVRC